MLTITITITIFVFLFSVSFTLYGFLRVTLNGIIPIQSADYTACMTKLTNSFPDLETSLSKNNHCISNNWDRVSYLKNNLKTFMILIVINIVYMLTFYFVFSFMVDVCKISLDNINSNLKYIAFIGYSILVLLIYYGSNTIQQVDGYEEIIKMTRYREFVKLKSKL